MKIIVTDLKRCLGCHSCELACAISRSVAKNLLGAILEDPKPATRVQVRRVGNQPVPLQCQQCDDAPCEPVCPTYASYHTSEGLNAQVYNRCIGTRYCANACPYTVRFFNFFNPVWEKPLHLQLNPDVSVREGGVVEKCTFCVQRIKAAEIGAKAEKRDLKDGEISPACVQSCPTSALVFGDLNDRESRVSHLSRSTRGTKLLGELGTQPKITYLERENRE